MWLIWWWLEPALRIWFSLLCGCHCPVRSGICFLVVGMEVPNCFQSVALGRWDWSIPTGRQARVSFVWSCSPLLSPFTCCVSSQITLLLGMLAVALIYITCFFVVTVVFFCLLVCSFVLPGHQHRSIGVRSQDCSNHGSRPTVDAMGQLKC